MTKQRSDYVTLSVYIVEAFMNLDGDFLHLHFCPTGECPPLHPKPTMQEIVRRIMKGVKRENLMSWSFSTKEPIKREEAFDRICELKPPDGLEGAAIAQFESAKAAAIEIAAVIPGPYVSVSMSGHANGVGWQKKEGYANDCITVSVTQQTEEDLKYFTKE
jgi:hypothetical protein